MCLIRKYSYVKHGNGIRVQYAGICSPSIAVYTGVSNTFPKLGRVHYGMYPMGFRTEVVGPGPKIQVDIAASDMANIATRPDVPLVLVMGRVFVKKNSRLRRYTSYRDEIWRE